MRMRIGWALRLAAVVLVLQVAVARRTLAPYAQPELAAAQKEAAFLSERLAPDEALLAVTTSYWSYFTRRPSVHLIIADPARFAEAISEAWAGRPTA